MDKNEIKQELLNMLLKLFPNVGISADILEYVDLIDDLGMDSITFISIVVEVEKVFRISVSDDMLLMENFRNTEKIMSIIEDAKNISAVGKKGDE